MKYQKGRSSLLDYYRDNFFNPVPIPVEDREAWNAHLAKRHNLYERHLGIPLSLLRERSVIEFGCGSGENALVLAMVGANLTLVEPNEQVLPRLNALFEKFGLSSRIKEIQNKSITEFRSKSHYDLVIAEGFLYTLTDRNKMIQKIVGLLNPGGLGVISFNDRYGGWIEFTKRLVLWRACGLTSEDVCGGGSLKLAKLLYGGDFANIKSSRSFDTWWKDTMINPFIASKYLWSFSEIFPLIERGGCSFLSCSPKWNFVDHFNWYKNTSIQPDLHKRILEGWRQVFSYILTGVKPKYLDTDPVSGKVMESVASLVTAISDYTSDNPHPNALDAISYPSVLDGYLSNTKDSVLGTFNKEMKRLYRTIKSADVNELIAEYRGAKMLRSLWGTPYHYLSFVKS